MRKIELGLDQRSYNHREKEKQRVVGIEPALVHLCASCICAVLRKTRQKPVNKAYWWAFMVVAIPRNLLHRVCPKVSKTKPIPFPRAHRSIQENQIPANIFEIGSCPNGKLKVEIGLIEHENSVRTAVG